MSLAKTALCLVAPIVLAVTSSSLHQAPQSVVSIFVEYPYYNSHGEAAKAFGTGAVISNKGYVITNHHVINQASAIAVQTHQGHKSYAKVVGTAPEFDIAVLKIEPSASENLPEIQYGEFDQLNIGDDVVAIGTPFGFEQTFTKGVVSNLDRHISLGTHVRSFIQVDAAVNPGNSGGPLLDQDGKLIGLVTGIYGPRLETSFNIGIALAIPVSIVKPVVSQIISQGHVTPGWLGISTQALTPELRGAFAKSNEIRGVLISEVLPQSPAERANLKEGDIITKVNNSNIQSPHHLSSLVTAHGSNTSLNLELIRENKTIKASPKTASPNELRAPDQSNPWGITLSEFKDATLTGERKSGVFIKHVSPHSAAALHGVIRGDQLLSINHKDVKQLEQLSQHELSQSDSPILKIKRDGRVFFVTL
ncbi:trypsin-like peptidase domain-containing protein [Gammaproteobacteria bacterium]|nr:trypsin-like peptidase domain-containing protein [Gammaproteobacteria bacterium]